MSIEQLQGQREQDRRPVITYDLAQYGFELKQYMLDANVPDAITPAVSAAQYQKVLHPYNSINYNPCLPHDVYMSNADVAAVSNVADNTAYSNQRFTFHSHATGYIAHMAIVAGFCENVSAYTNGSVTMNSVVFTITTWRAPGEPYDQFIFETAPTTAFTALTATGAQIFQCFEHIPADKRLRTIDSQPITLDVSITETVSGTNTRQVGLMPTFPLWGSPANQAKPWTVPQVIMNIKPGLNSVDFIGRG
jgi:hypothetical protein